ncbi:hypothetical protein ACRALDRAFT_2019335 [Sodiomyces alcalophilus JCM 7366]|uniref:uncharacterized protein n=1 Tax=Sodiomyces alcalophilus JCM 7366 TaxID=591952 RepID=UPI0039B5F070
MVYNSVQRTDCMKPGKCGQLERHPILVSFLTALFSFNSVLRFIQPPRVLAIAGTPARNTCHIFPVPCPWLPHVLTEFRPLSPEGLRWPEEYPTSTDNARITNGALIHHMESIGDASNQWRVRIPRGPHSTVGGIRAGQLTSYRDTGQITGGGAVEKGFRFLNNRDNGHWSVIRQWVHALHLVRGSLIIAPFTSSSSSTTAMRTNLQSSSILAPALSLPPTSMPRDIMDMQVNAHPAGPNPSGAVVHSAGPRTSTTHAARQLQRLETGSGTSQHSMVKSKETVASPLPSPSALHFAVQASNATTPSPLDNFRTGGVRICFVVRSATLLVDVCLFGFYQRVLPIFSPGFRVDRWKCKAVAREQSSIGFFTDKPAPWRRDRPIPGLTRGLRTLAKHHNQNGLTVIRPKTTSIMATPEVFYPSHRRGPAYQSCALCPSGRDPRERCPREKDEAHRGRNDLEPPATSNPATSSSVSSGVAKRKGLAPAPVALEKRIASYGHDASQWWLASFPLSFFPGATVCTSSDRGAVGAFEVSQGFAECEKNQGHGRSRSDLLVLGP